MSAVKIIRNYAAFNTWANKRMRDFLFKSEDAVLSASVISSFQSISATMEHILKAQKFWTAFVRNDDIENFVWISNTANPKEIIQELADHSVILEAYITSLSEEQLNEILHLHTRWAKNSLPRYEYVLHCINHGTYHRGQVITLATQLCIEKPFPGTDYNFYHTKMQAGM